MEIDYAKDVFVFLLAGGKGERLNPLTRDRSKPAVPFGGKFRIIDFTLSNCVNSGFRKVAVVTQYKSSSLQRHLALGWSFLSSRFNEYIIDLPPQQRLGERWYLGTADAVFQNLYFIDQEKPKYVVILSGDHVYKMDYRKMIQYHIDNKADITAAAVIVDRSEASAFGVIEVEKDYRIVSFKEKPKEPPHLPDNESKSLASMGIYVFNAEAINRLLIHDAELSTSSHDFGKDILPYAVNNKLNVYAYRFIDFEGKEEYWQDVGTIDSFYTSNIDLLSNHPKFDLFDRKWPIYTHSRQFPPSKITYAEVGGEKIESRVLNSIIGEGAIISGAEIINSIIFYNVRIKAGSKVSNSIIFGDSSLGYNVKLNRCIVDKEVEIPDNAQIGFNIERDKKYFYLSPKGIAVIPKRYKFTKSFMEELNEERI